MKRIFAIYLQHCSVYTREMRNLLHPVVAPTLHFDKWSFAAGGGRYW